MMTHPFVDCSEEEESLPTEVSLTRREQEVLVLADSDLTAVEIASQLSIEQGTAEFHLASIREKFGVNRIRKALKRARELGIYA
jgi:ATP/maltotriose-dependent transcriptional regulator MalT